jgi:hypothetical protein
MLGKLAHSLANSCKGTDNRHRTRDTSKRRLKRPANNSTPPTSPLVGSALAAAAAGPPAAWQDLARGPAAQPATVHPAGRAAQQQIADAAVRAGLRRTLAASSPQSCTRVPA